MKLISQIMSIYAELDLKVSEFKIKSGLRCPQSCGVCCGTAHVQTTVLEMLPVALEILKKGESDIWLGRIGSQTPSGLCVFYQVERAPDSPGHCTIYGLRPAVCRLFGFAAVHTRTGSKVLAACSHLKKNYPEALSGAVKYQHEAPCFSESPTQLYTLEPNGNLQLIPINEALTQALFRIGLHLQLADGDTSADKSVA